VGEGDARQRVEAGLEVGATAHVGRQSAW
jgi:hypothetical protein